MSSNEVVCTKNDLVENSGVCVLFKGEQVAIFYIPSCDKKIFAIANWDPIGKANVLSRGIVGDIEGHIVVASPLYKQHFNLNSGICLEDETQSVKIYRARLENNTVLLS